MILRKWETLPEQLRTEAVRPYYDVLQKKRWSLAAKRLFDIVVFVRYCYEIGINMKEGVAVLYTANGNK